ncbi:hypothetical protein L596_019208 [Steinernema carpocapsae]|uniref:Uncharacterized protein n=1 Tax=Steinernema carpocapsae TaxID=34508 RepID=A0A4U5MQB7_STECR|nr:hypothetical protein L596_019208 [Steinernema carpocapsae]
MGFRFWVVGFKSTLWPDPTLINSGGSQTILNLRSVPTSAAAAQVSETCLQLHFCLLITVVSITCRSTQMLFQRRFSVFDMRSRLEPPLASYRRLSAAKIKGAVHLMRENSISAPLGTGHSSRRKTQWTLVVRKDEGKSVGHVIAWRSLRRLRRAAKGGEKRGTGGD